MSQKIMVGLSGGVDSAVAALKLKEQGADVTAVLMQNWQEDSGCSSTTDLADARAICAHLSIPLRTVRFDKSYWRLVFQQFLDAYAQGRTPNPDVLCNKEIKFKKFLDFACAQGAQYIATGHYARIERDDQGLYRLLKAKDTQKDQSYFLHLLNQKQLAHSLFPLGALTKTQVRATAKAHGIPVHDKKDSTGICFIGEQPFKAFLSQYLLAKPGLIESDDGRVLGTHDGLMFYTLGQRKGMGLGGIKNAQEKPWFVIKKDLKRNVLVVGQGAHPLLFSDTLECTHAHWISGSPPLQLSCHAKIRYRQPDQACTLTPIQPQHYRVTFSEPQRAITPGQSIVFYDGDTCLGGAIITALDGQTHL